MTERDHALLVEQMEATAENVREFARQIESGQYGNHWQVTTPGGESADVLADDEENALYHGQLALGVGDEVELEAEHLQADEPMVDEETPIGDYPLEIVDERGREYAIVLSTGGPHIEVVADGLQSARLEGYWGGDRYTMHGDYFDTFLDYFIERDKGGPGQCRRTLCALCRPK